MGTDAREYVTVGEAAGIMRAHRNTVYRWISTGLLRATRTPGGRGIRLRRADLFPAKRRSA